MWYLTARVNDTIARRDYLSDPDPLVLALRQGDHDALVTVYRQHQGAVRAFARRLLGVDADAEELVQDTFVTLPKALTRFRGESTLRTFLLGITARSSRNYLRSRRRRRALLERVATLESAQEGSAEGPDSALQSELLAQRLRLAMERLSLDQRLAFVLVEVEERSSFEAAEILGVAASTVRSRAQAARRKLQEVLEGDEHRG